jgi:pyranose oxidase
MSDETLQVDTLIVGSGPIGATFARKLVEDGQHVLMVEAGAQLSQRPGEHLKNPVLYQRNLNLFSSFIRGHLHLLSVPSRDQAVVTLDPSAYRVDRQQYGGFVSNIQNPEQDPDCNLDAAAACYAVGGMATHRTCATPRHHPFVERSNLLTDAEWDVLYDEAEHLFNTRTDVFSASVRHQVVLEALRITFESFSSSVVSAELSNALCIWRVPWTDSRDVASHARQFLDAQLHAVGAPEAAEVD